MLVIVIVIVLAAIAPEGHELDAAPLTIAAVQGGGEQGTSALDVPSQQVTHALLEATATIQPSDELDLVVWPENGIDVDDEPFEGSAQHAAVAAEAARLGVPFSVGITEDSEFSNHPERGRVRQRPGGRHAGRARSPAATRRCGPCRSASTSRSAALLEALGAPLDEVPNDAVAGHGPGRQSSCPTARGWA